MKKFLSIAFLAAVVLGLSACNTIRGIGKDVQKAGEVVEEAGKKD
ncbi:MAG: entericidin A/B family lipoprotein [Arenimonas sp.]